jgi:MFS transporter, putative metabolite:H+ symporter
MEKRIVSIDQAIEEIGYGKFQRRLLWICGLGWAADAMEVLLIAFILPAIGEEWGLSATQKGFLATGIFLGMLLGSFLWGRISDLLGRKLGFIATIGIDSGFGLLSALSPSFLVLLILRSLTGFGVGGTLPVNYSLFSEFIPAKNRGKNLVYLEAFWALGTIAAAGFSWLVVPTFGWRWLLVISAIPGLIVFLIRRYVPESPRFLLSQGKTEDAMAVLDRIATINNRQISFDGLEAVKIQKSKTKDLFRSSYRKSTFLLWAIWFMISLGYYGVFSWLPNYFRTIGMDLLPVYRNTFILALAQVPGYFSAAYFVEKWGRKKTLGIYLLASGVFTYLFAIATSLSFIVFMGIWMSFFALGAWGALYAYTPEIYPTPLRATGMGSASAMTRIAGAIAPVLGGILMGESFFIPLLIFSSAYFLASMASFFMPVETKGKPLEDVLV